MFSLETSTCSKCGKSTKGKHCEVVRIKTSKMPCIKRSGYCEKAYYNRINMAVVQKKLGEKLDLKNSWDEQEGTDVGPYPDRAYVLGSHKGFEHARCGELTEDGLENYKKFIDYLICENPVGIENDVTYNSANPGLVDPLSGFATQMIGATQCAIPMGSPPPAFGDAHAAQIVENQTMNLVENIPFCDWNDEPTPLQDALDLLNIPQVKNNIPEAAKKNGEDFTPGNAYRVLKNPNPFPYVSQFLYFNLVANNSQIYDHTYRGPKAAGNETSVAKWGFNRGQAAAWMNGQSTEDYNMGSPGTNSGESAATWDKFFVFSGHNLGMLVRGDPTTKFGEDLAYQLRSLTRQVGSRSLKLNPGLPSYNTMSGNSTAASTEVESLVGYFGNQARAGAYAWKWNTFRRLRPQAAALALHCQLTEGEDKDYGWPLWLINNADILNAIANKNQEYLDEYQSLTGDAAVEDEDVDKYYTYAQNNRGAAPAHPSVPAAHSVIIGSSIALLKFIYHTSGLKLKDIPELLYKGDKSLLEFRIFPEASLIDDTEVFSEWSDLADPEASFPVIMQANADGSQVKLIRLLDDRTVDDEINKFADNFSQARSWLGVHYTQDNVLGIRWGFLWGLRALCDLLASWRQNDIVNGEEISPRVYIPGLEAGESYLVTPTSCKIFSCGKEKELWNLSNKIPKSSEVPVDFNDENY